MHADDPGGGAEGAWKHTVGQSHQAGQGPHAQRHWRLSRYLFFFSSPSFRLDPSPGLSPNHSASCALGDLHGLIRTWGLPFQQPL